MYGELMEAFVSLAAKTRPLLLPLPHHPPPTTITSSQSGDYENPSSSWPSGLRRRT